MKLCRFTSGSEAVRIGLVETEATIKDLSAAGITCLENLLEDENRVEHLNELEKMDLPRVAMDEAGLLAPIERQEVWAAGVTYLRSKKARMEESDFSATAYDKVYEAPRPELFFKALAEKVVGPGEKVGIRQDARWSVPEPELALVLNSRGQIVGCTIGNDMSSRDIEGENLLYLPQAKIYEKSCALGPWIVIGPSEEEARHWKIGIRIDRGRKEIFAGETSVGQIKRRFEELSEFLFRSQRFPHGAVLLTGTGVIPPDDFTLRPEDLIEIAISGIGLLRNAVMTV